MLILRKVFSVTTIGHKFEHVICDRCQCEYYYPKIRLEEGHASTPLGLDTAKAEQAAEEQSLASITKTLDREMDLVPCPKCSWISTHLVTGYRDSLFQMPLGCAGVLSIIFFVYAAAWLLSERKWSPMITTLLSGGFIAYPFASLIRWIVLCRFDPNRQFPLPPKLPTGTPPAYYLDEVSGTFRLATSNRPEQSPTDYWLTFNVGADAVVTRCITCLTSDDLTKPFELTVKRSMKLALPQCSACGSRNEKTSCRAVFVGLLVITVLVAVILFVFARTAFYIPLLIPLLFGIFYFFTRFDRLFSPAHYQCIDEGRGIIKLHFRNEEYQQLMSQQIADRLKKDQ